ncbi:MAG TPA: 2OG-Fe(II) oxygenase [Hyphomonadaceae bacterium]|nr:2OG-Fe(II) oxygenase [Hyphomonadaceae bacterium]
MTSLFPSIGGSGAFEKTLAANRLLVGNAGMGADPVAATQLYEEAAAGGAGAAAARLAVLAAAGVAREPNWGEALDRLTDAAELGDRLAQQQLAVIAGHDHERMPEGGGARWHNMRVGIDLKTLMKPAPLRRVSISPSIAEIDGLITPVMCRWIMHRAGPRMEPGQIIDYATGQGVADPNRTGLSAGFGLLDTDVVMVLAQERLARATSLVVHQQEVPHVLSYEPGQEFRPHVDYLNPEIVAYQQELSVIGQRVATALTWLNDDFDGGETEFPRANMRFRRKPGDAILFLNVLQGSKAPDPMSMHAGLAPRRGKKWILSQWVRDKVQAII